jgi:hypothetical protein
LHQKPAVGQDTVVVLWQTFSDTPAGGADPQGEEVPGQSACVSGWQPVTPVNEYGLFSTDLESEVFDTQGRMLISRGGVLSDSGIAHRDRLGMTGLGSGRRGDGHDIRDASVGEALPELGDLAVTSVGGQQRRP